MTTSPDEIENKDAGEHQQSAADPGARGPRFGAATPAVVTVGIFVVSIVTWWLLADPRWSLIGARAGTEADYAHQSAVVSCLLFWTIFGHIFTGFTFGNWPFSRLRQPVAGLVQILVDLAIGVVGTLLFTRVVGSWDPTFSASTAGGAGYTAAAFIVLIGFYAYAFASAGVGGYPFDEVRAPLASVAQWFLAAFLTVIGVVALIYPNFNANLAATAPIPLPTAAGWVYSSIVIVIVAAMQWGNWPWGGVGNRHLRAVAALVVTLGGGYVLMLVFQALLRAIVPGSVQDGPAFAIGLEAAQLGVCFSLWSLIVGLVFGPSKIKSVLSARLIRTLVVAVAAVLTYVVFMRFFATTVLHFPGTGSYGGNPLLWMDWTILVVLWHSVALGGHLGTRPAAPVAKVSSVA
jgi:AAT family amino acid transporter